MTDADVAQLVAAIRSRVRRYLRRRGQWPDEEGAGEVDAVDAWLELSAASAQGRAALGERAGERDVRIGSGTRREPFVKAPLCVDRDGFSLHAAVCVAARDRERLEKPCRYAGRPAIAESRLRELPDGRVAYSFKQRWKDGTSAVVMDKQVLMEWLCALVPRPKRHLVTYHGVLAPAAGLRPQVVPAVVEGGGGESCRHGRGGEERVDEGSGGGLEERAAAARVLLQRRVPHAPGKRRRGRRRYTSAELLRRVFAIEVFVCVAARTRSTRARILRSPSLACCRA